MSKMSLHDPFAFLKHKLWPKEGAGVKVPIWLPTTKSQKSPWFTYVQVASHIPLKRSWWGLQLCFKGLQKTLWASKITKVPILRILGISRLIIWESRNKMTFGCRPVAKHREYYKDEGGGFSKVQAMVNIVSLCLLVALPCTKSDQTIH